MFLRRYIPWRCYFWLANFRFFADTLGRLFIVDQLDAVVFQEHEQSIQPFGVGRFVGKAGVDLGISEAAPLLPLTDEVLKGGSHSWSLGQDK
ncbi:hypothetical protein AYO44_15840 [Planctomycetaceae bacterium SCGC AG-212-F19]|nr:hypothetical protein AYO44_15840 [Planctomycetaceae bacterium SCGC AG-212-F19]